MTSAERWEQCAPVSHERDDRFDVQDGNHAFPNAPAKWTPPQRGMVYTQRDLRAEAFKALRAKNAAEIGHGHVGLAYWSIRIFQLKNGQDRIHVLATGWNHSTHQKLTASAVL